MSNLDNYSMKGKTISTMMMIVLFSTMVVECTNDVPQELIDSELSSIDTTNHETGVDSTVCFVIAKGGNFRIIPNGTIIGALNNGDTLKIIQESDTVTVKRNGDTTVWTQAESKDGKIGFIANSLLKLDEKWYSLIKPNLPKRDELADAIGKSYEDSAMHYILWQEKLVGVVVIKDTTFAKFTNDSLFASNIAKLNSAMEKQLREKKQIEQTSQSDWLLCLIGFLGLLLGIIITCVTILVIKTIRRKRKGKTKRQEVVLEAKEATSVDKRHQFLKQLIITK